MRFGGWKELFPTAHIEKMKGNFAQNEKYCSKEGKLIEFGELPKQDKRTDLVEVKKLLDEGKQPMEIADKGLKKPRAHSKQTPVDSCMQSCLYFPMGHPGHSVHDPVLGGL